MFIDFPEVNVKVEGMEGVHIPKMVKISQTYDDTRIPDIEAHMNKELDNLPQATKDSVKGKSICITCGSRGIPDLKLMIKCVVDKLKEWGAEPFIIPAMGSHGGGTAEGQLEIVNGYGVTEEYEGCPIKSSMDVVQIGELKDGTPVYCDKYAYEADGIVVLNKVKPHTEFKGDHESGIMKMMAIGLAKHKGASMFHMKGFARFKDGIPELADVFLEKANVVFGVGIVQNAYDYISEIEVMETSKIKERDAALLKIAKSRIPGFKFPKCELLIIDEIGKNISGNGFDSNVVGLCFDRKTKDFDGIFDFQKMIIRGLTPESHHNGNGIGACDFSTRRCLNDIDWDLTWVNGITATIVGGIRIPVYMNNDRDAIALGIRTCVNVHFDDVRIVRIKNTLEMGEIWVSENMIPEIKDIPGVKIIGEPEEFQFDADGYIKEGC
ncbi:MAG: DUF2088 domain-containing protein [Clostridiales bacterium]|nr:DUF2088 domain-containing protein [Clostridiales bacterium]